MSEPGTVIRRKFEVQLGNGRAGHRKLREGKPKPKTKEPVGSSRLARLLALAHHFDDMIREGVVKDQAESARLCHVSRARVTQIMNLLFLAPDIQEEILFLAAGPNGKAAMSAKRIRHIVAEVEWDTQRALWHSPIQGHRRAARLTEVQRVPKAYSKHNKGPTARPFAREGHDCQEKRPLTFTTLCRKLGP